MAVLCVLYLLEIVGANRFAIGAVHHESAALRRAAFIDAAIHASAVQGHAPTFFISLHDAQPIGEMRGEMRRDDVVWPKNHGKTAADRVT